MAICSTADFRLLWAGGEGRCIKCVALGEALGGGLGWVGSSHCGWLPEGAKPDSDAILVAGLGLFICLFVCCLVDLSRFVCYVQIKEA